jgi:regulator of protease activity HflC (stomatin/prohibitin superfamily)
MFLLVLGLLIVVFSFFISRDENPLSRFIIPFRAFGVALCLLGAGLSMFKVVEAGQVGVQTLYGKVDNDILYSGLHIINPLVEVTTFDVNTKLHDVSRT